MENTEVRKMIKSSGVKQWQIAHELGISEATLVRWLRFDLSQERKNAITEAVNALKEA